LSERADVGETVIAEFEKVMPNSLNTQNLTPNCLKNVHNILALLRARMLLIAKHHKGVPDRLQKFVVIYMPRQNNYYVAQLP
jgi:hypothetical protein